MKPDRRERLLVELVAPHAGAWIETAGPACLVIPTLGRPSRGGVD